MALASGTRLGPYEIVAPLGAGGMGEVYRARDTKLGREVAIKVLSEYLSDRPEALARFEREAKAVAALSHPNILAIFDFGSQDGTVYAAMELLEGESLRVRLAGGALGTRKAVEIGAQVAHGLAAAHDKGIVHRDLKPDNVFITRDGAVKVLDFGLARHDAGTGTDDDSRSPTLSRHTDPGTVMGTVGYMSPEQVRGVTADHRSDIFSFGSVLYEMLSGRRAFQRETAAETMTAVLKEDPADLGSLVPGLPSAVERIVQHCLEKRPEERFQSARDLAFDLGALGGSVSGPRAIEPRTTRTRGLLLRGTLALLVGAALFQAGRRSVGSAGTTTATTPVTYQQLTDASGVEGRPSLAPDGKSVVYVSGAAGNSDIFLLRVGGRNPVNLTADSKGEDSQPAFSPDGELIAFRSERQGGGVFVMGSTGESVRRVTDFGYTPAWSPDGKRIVVATDTFALPTELPGRGGPLRSIDLETGQAGDVTGPGTALQPRWSPNGLRIAFWGLRGTSGQRDIWTAAADGSEAQSRVEVTNDRALDWCPVWAPDGRSLYFASDRAGSMNLWRVAIDERSGRVLGAPEAQTTPAGWSGGFSLSKDGRRIAFETLDWRSTLLRVPFDPVAERITGAPEAVLHATQPMRDHEVSPDGQQVAFTRAGTREDLFVARIDGSLYTRLTDDAFRDRGPAWSPDGQRIAFYSDRGGSYEIWTIRPDGSGLEALTAVERSANFPSWSPDGSRLVFSSPSSGGLIVDPTQGTRRTTVDELPRIRETVLFWPLSWSPDGRRLAGAAVELTGRVVASAVYTLDSRSFALLEDPAGSTFRYTCWLNDSQRILLRDERGLWLLDIRSRKARPLLGPKGHAFGKSVGITRDNRWITFTESAGEGDIWLASFD
jgi:eukaryotic-like serine/threonine-protein kinase